MPGISLGHLTRRFIPAAKENRNLPAEQQLVIHLRGVGMRESQAYIRQLRTLAMAQQDVTRRIADAVRDGEAPAVDDEETLLEAMEQIERLHMGAIDRIELGDQSVSDIEDIWTTLEQDSEVRDEAIRECQRAYGVIGSDEVPLSGQASTGG